MASFPSVVLQAPFRLEPRPEHKLPRAENKRQTGVQTPSVGNKIRFRGANSLGKHERNEVTLFRCGTFSAEHVVAVSSKPFFRFRLIAVTLWIRRGCHRLNVLSRTGLADLSCVCGVAGRAGGCVGLAGREIGPEKMLASLSRKSAESGVGGFRLARIEVENGLGRFACGGGRKRAGQNDDRNQAATRRFH
jgi:hypothetical protein